MESSFEVSYARAMPSVVLSLLLLSANQDGGFRLLKQHVCLYAAVLPTPETKPLKL